MLTINKLHLHQLTFMLAMTTAISPSAALQAACHCGAVRFTVRFSDGVINARRCNCSYCRMRGAVAVSAHLADIHV